MSISDPKYPAHTWQIKAGGDIEVTISGVQETIALAGSGLWGFGPDSASDATAGDLAHYVAQQVATHSGLSSASAAWVTGTTYTEPRYTLTLTAPVAQTSAPEIKGPEALMRALGLHGTPSGGLITVAGSYTPSGSISSLTTTGFNDGVWSPNRDAAFEEVVVARVARQVRSPTSPSAYTVTSLGTADGRTVSHLAVDRRHITQERAAQALYAAQAGTDTGDTYGTLDRLIDAAVDGQSLRLYRAAGDYTAVGLVWEDGLATDDLATSESVGGRRVRVVLPYIDQ